MNARLPAEALSSTQKYTTVFTSGNRQAVRLPKEFRIDTKQVAISREGECIVIRPKYLTAAQALEGLPPLSQEDADEFDRAMAIVKDLQPLEERDWGLEATPTTQRVRSTQAKRAKSTP